MKYQVGDLIISKDSRNRKRACYITEINRAVNGWSRESITIQYFQGDRVRLSVSLFETALHEPCAHNRWKHYPVKV